MKLPGAESGIVPRRKVEDYLLNLEHPIGGGKAKFFMHFGFQRERWEELAAPLLRHAQENPVTETVTDADGITYIIESGLTTHSGRQPQVRSVWILETGGLRPASFTAYPSEA